MNCLWDYQLPLCDPRSYWRSWGVDRDLIHFAPRRKPNRQRCYAILDGESPGPTSILSKTLHEELWAEFDMPRRRDWCATVLDSVGDRYASVIARLEEVGYREDPTCQAGIDQFIFLGPFDWLVREVACVDFCHAELSIPRDDALYIPLESLLHSGSLVFTFEKLCIMCDRPIAIEPRIEFRDGSVFE
jgi:hypothetical protein